MNSVKHLSTLGIFVFIILYFYAASLYPGGSQADAHAQGFSWLHNYWCNLTNEAAMNGQVNPARPVAIAAMLILCAGLAIFFVRFGSLYVRNRHWRNLIQAGGVSAMVAAALIFTPYHDAMTIIASVLGVFAVLGMVKEVYHSRQKGFKYTGAICVALLLVNNYIYYTQNGLVLLPLLQKITFALVLAWVVAMNHFWRG